MNLLIVLMVTFLTIIFADQDFQNKELSEVIIDGVEIPISLYPFIVQLTSEGSHICGGSIISKRVILTAAHCIHTSRTLLMPFPQIDVYVGSAATFGGTKYKACRLLPHEMYDPMDLKNDVGLILLTKNIRFGPNVQMVNIAPDKKFMRAKSEVIATGFGVTNLLAQRSINLKATLGRYVDPVICRESQLALEFRSIPQYVFCVIGRKWTGACYGDSGSAVIWKNYLVGIVTADMVCGSDVVPTLFTDMVHFRKWIYSNVKKLESIPKNECIDYSDPW